MNTKNIGFIGGGNMAFSLLSGLLASGHLAENLWVCDICEQTREKLTHLSVHVSTESDDVVKHADVLVLAVKPQVIQTVAQQIATQLNAKTVVISIAAGINQTSLSHWLGENRAIVRCMPNTPALVLSGATVLHANHYVNTQQRNLAETILRSVGIALWVDDEKDLDAVTAVSGSGPAYFFLLMEAMESAAIELGLPPQMARLLVQQTAFGSAKIALESPDSPAELRRKVTSPNGTTHQAIGVFEQHGFTELVLKALHAARDRSIELSEQAQRS